MMTMMMTMKGSPFKGKCKDGKNRGVTGPGNTVCWLNVGEDNNSVNDDGDDDDDDSDHDDDHDNDDDHGERWTRLIAFQ